MTPDEIRSLRESVAAIEEIARHLKDCEKVEATNNPEADFGIMKGTANMYGRQLEGRINVIKNIVSRL